MRVFCSGFNLYGQFIKCHSSVVEAFIDCHYDEVTNLEVSHTFCVVSNESSAFVHGAKDAQTHQIQKIKLPEALQILQTSCTDKRILLLTKSGGLFKLDLDKVQRNDPAPLPNLICSEPNENETDKIIKISAGSKINIALSQEGKLFSLPNKLNFENENIVDICTGCEHCLILDCNGNVYSFGRGSRGQLGHGSLEDETEPVLIEALAGITISKIAAGGWHSCAVSAEGDLYSWGWNGNGQLGLSKVEKDAVAVMATPHAVDFGESHTEEQLDINVTNVACGNRHTVALLDSRKLFGAGWNKYHQLGITNNPKENLYYMTLLHNFADLKVSALKCGPWSTAVIVS